MSGRGVCERLKITHFSQTFISFHFLSWPPTSTEAPSLFPMHSNFRSRQFDIHEAHFLRAKDMCDLRRNKMRCTQIVYRLKTYVAHMQLDRGFFSLSLHFIAFGYALPSPPAHKRSKFFTKLDCNRRQLVHTAFVAMTQLRHTSLWRY